MGRDEAENLPKELVEEEEEEGIFSQQKKEYVRKICDSEPVTRDNGYKDECVAFKEEEDWRTISSQKSPEVGPSPRG